MFKILGKNPSGELKKKVQASKNFRGGKFNNLLHTKMFADDSTILKMISDLIKATPNRKPHADIPALKSNLLHFPNTETHLTWFGHSSYHIFMDGKHILVDPVFSGHASPIPSMVKAFAGTNIYNADDFADIDILILTHDHYDHLDYKTLKSLKSRIKSIYCSLGVASHLHYWGFSNSIINELDWWESAEITENIRLTATPARHFSGRTLKRAQTLWSSFVLENKTQRLFIGGDSGYGNHFKEIGEKFESFDLAILECGQYNSKWPFIHMTPEQTVQANIDLHSKQLLPVHWGKFALAYHPWNEPINRLVANAKSSGVDYTTPKIGETIIIGTTKTPNEWWNF